MAGVAAGRITYQIAGKGNGARPRPRRPVARSRRSLRRLKRKFALEKAATGSGYPALIPRIDQRGNRTRRLEAEVESLIQETIDAYFVVPQRPSVSHVYNTHLVPACKERNLPVPSRKTFYTRIKRQPVHPVAKVRLGVRGAYALEPALLELSIHLPKHGDRPFEVAHIDHTQADIELMNSTFTTNLGRPWISVAICAYSRRILAIYISFDPPSQISVMMLLRLIVQRWNRLPEAIVVDGGREFQSVYFEKLLAHYEITKIVRPKSKPRFGSVIERAFGTINTELFNNLAGNTQIMKNIRWVTKDNNPKREAVWTLPALHKALEYWGNEIYDIKIHSGLGRSPSEQFALGTWFSGSRPMRFIPYTTDFIISTYPTTQKGTARVQANVGVKINGVYYYCDAMRKVIKADVFVRYDPFDLGVAYAYIQGEWMKCYSQYRAKFLHLSEREREHITKELKKRGTANREFNELFFRKWGDLANIIAQTEAWGRLSKQQAENRMVRELTGGSPIPDEPQIFDVVIAHDVMVEEKRPAELRPGANNKVVDYGEL